MKASRVFLFCFSAAKLSLFPFLPVYFHAWRITPFQLGCLYGTKHLVSMLLLPLLMKLAVKSKMQRCLVFLMGLVVFAGVSAFVWDIDPYQGDNSDYCGQSTYWKESVAANSHLQMPNKQFPSIQTHNSKIETFYDASLDYPNEQLEDVEQWLDSTSLTPSHQEPKASDLEIQRSDKRFHYGSPKGARDHTSNQDLLSLLEKIAQSRGNTSSMLLPVPGKDGNGSFPQMNTNSTALVIADLLYSWAFGILLISELFLNAIQFIAEDSLWDFLEATNLLDHFEEIKRWSSYGSLSGSVSVCFMTGFGMCRSNCINPFLYHASCSSIFAILAAGFLSLYPVEYFTNYTYHPSAMVTAGKLCLRDIHNTPYLLVGFLVGFLTFGFDVIHLWYLRDLGAPALLLALLLAIQSLVEITFQVFCKKWKRPTPPYHWMLCVALLAAAIQSLSYCFIRAMWVFILIEFVFAFRHTLSVFTLEAFTEYISPPGVERSVRFIFLFVYLGPGMGLGSFYSGSLYNTFGSVIFYRIHSIVVFILLALVVPLKFVLPTRIYSFSRILSHCKMSENHATVPLMPSDSSDSSVEMESQNAQKG
ncbi:MF6LB protein, partial [Polyodon spathula]|nr:MF6LB protein [Polyodon spathula]